MTCRHADCRQPIRRCQTYGCEHGGWLHTRTGLHACGANPHSGQRAEPDTRALPVTETPGAKPRGAVA